MERISVTGLDILIYMSKKKIAVLVSRIPAVKPLTLDNPYLMSEFLLVK